MKNKKGNYFKIPNTIFKERLSGNQFIVYCYLSKCSDKQNKCFPSRETIAKNCCIKSLSTVDKILQLLEDKGLITKTYRYNPSGIGFQSNVYTINDL
ncbi:MAG: helix-turn-helix domain-containing protein [Eubacterium sp.]